MEGHAESSSGGRVVTRSDDAPLLFHHLTDTTWLWDRWRTRHADAAAARKTDLSPQRISESQLADLALKTQTLSTTQAELAAKRKELADYESL